MTARHKKLNFVRGDEWRIAGPLLNSEGFPIILDPAPSAIEWALYDEQGAVAYSGTLADGTIVITDANAGEIAIVVDGVDSKTIPAGDYQDQLRLTVDGTPMTMWIGQVEVEFSPFEIEPAAP